ncbi:hypothetical protein GJ496_002532 [Pomphorhynchus laevis]|nr:hypothetical protein GJ496_002532 [Pomphorhynchus laevis]
MKLDRKENQTFTVKIELTGYNLVSVAHTGALDCDNSEVTYERRSESSVLFPRNTASNATSHNSVLIINDDIYPYPKNKASNSTGHDSVLITHYNVSQNAIGNNSVRSSVPPYVIITRANKARQLNDDRSCYVIISGLLKQVVVLALELQRSKARTS